MSKGRIREDILEYLKAQQYVSSHDALEYVHYPLNDVNEAQFELDFEKTLDYFLAHVESLEAPPPPPGPLLIGESGTCVFCKEPFSNANVFTEPGWLETSISGSCETCFDRICRDPTEPE